MSKPPKLHPGALKTARFVRVVPPTVDKNNPKRSASALMGLDDGQGGGIDVDVLARWLGVEPLPEEGEFQVVLIAPSGRWYDTLQVLVACAYRLAAYEAYSRDKIPGTVA